MSRNLPLAALAVLPLLTVMVGCGGDGDGGRADSAPGTVAVGGVLDAFPSTEPPTATTDPPVPTTEAEPATTTTVRRRTTTTTAAPQPTWFAYTLGGLVDPNDPWGPLATERLIDDTGRLSMDVPVDWGERATSTGRLPDGSAAPYLAAAPAMRRFLDGYDVAGITVVVLPGADDLEAALDSYRFGQDCQAEEVQPYRGAQMSGEYEVFRDCGGTDTDIVTVVAEPDGRVGTVLLLAQIREHADLVALDTALETMSVAGAD